MNLEHYFNASDGSSLGPETDVALSFGASPVLATPLAVVVGIGVASFIGGYVAGAAR